MTEHVRIVCDHAGGRKLPAGARPGSGPKVIDRWFRERPGSWTSATDEVMQPPDGLDAAREHERTVIHLAEASERAAAKLVDDRDRVRLRGGPTETRRGYIFACPTCPASPRVKHVRLMAALDACAAAGWIDLTLQVLDTPS